MGSELKPNFLQTMLRCRSTSTQAGQSRFFAPDGSQCDWDQLEPWGLESTYPCAWHQRPRDINVQAAADGLTNCRSQHSTLLLPMNFMLTIDFKLPGGFSSFSLGASYRWETN